MYLKLVAVIIVLALAGSLVGLGVSWANRGAALIKLEEEVRWQEKRYENLVERARQVQETLEAQQARTLEWQTRYNDLSTRGPEIRRQTQTITQRIPEYIPIEVQNQRAEQALWGLAAFVSAEIAPMVEGE